MVSKVITIYDQPYGFPIPTIWFKVNYMVQGQKLPEVALAYLLE